MGKKPPPPSPAPFFALAPRGQGWPLIALFGVWAAVVCFNYFAGDRFSPFDLSLVVQNLPPVLSMRLTALTRHLVLLAKLAAAVIVTTGVGRAVIKRALKIDGLNVLESLFFSYALGLGILGYLMFALAAVGALSMFVVAALSVSLAAAALWFNRDCAARPASLVRDPRSLLPSSAWSALGAAVTVLILALYGFYCLAPEVFYDSLVYHLALPNLYKLEGGFVPTPYNMYSGIPMQFQMVYLWALFADGDSLAKLLHWSAGLCIAVGMLGAARRCGKPAAGWLAAAIFFSTPIVTFNQTRSGVDVATSLWVLASVHAAAIGLAGPPAASRRWFVLSAIMTGLAMASKYTVWPYLAVVVLSLALLRAERREIALYAAAASACLTPWLAKNAWFYGNPIFPYLQDKLNPGAYPIDWHAFVGPSWPRDWPAILRSGQSLLHVLANPWYVTMGGATEFDHVGPIFLLGLPAFLWLRMPSREARLWVLAVIGLWISWTATTGMARFFMPGMALMSVLIALAVMEVEKPVARHAAAALIFALAWNNFAHGAGVLARSGTESYLIQGEPRSSYLARSRLTYTAPYYSAAEWINAHAPKNARVLIVGDGRGYYVERPFVAYTTVDENLFSFWLARSGSPGELKARLESAGVTHILVNMGYLIRTKQPIAFDAKRLETLDLFLKKYTRMVYADQEAPAERWTGVFELVPDAGPNQPSSLFYYWYANRLGFRKA